MRDPSDQPNVLLILTDDQGFDDLGCHGNTTIETPNLDALAAESVQFANYYVTPVCAPTRASLLTGRNFLRTGVTHVHGGKDFVHPDELLMPQLFRDAGYRTGMWGKWHSGKTTGYFPWERGFEEAYMARLYVHHNSHGRFNGEPREHEGWTVDTLTDYAMDFITRHRDEPWFAYVPHLTVHAPLVAREDIVAKYQAKGAGEKLATAFAMIEQLDTGVGRLLAHIDNEGLAENTIVVFMSDDGPQYLGLDEHDLAIRYPSGYKGHKGSMWENGIKSPLFVRWRRAYAAHTVERLCDVCDVLPTLLDICGIRVPAAHPGFDGRSIVPYLAGHEEALAPKEAVVFSNLGWPPEKNEADQQRADEEEYAPVPPEARADVSDAVQLMSLRTETHKLLMNPGYAAGAPDAVRGRVLIDMTNDPREDRNLVDSHAEAARKMEGRLCAWFNEAKLGPHAFHAPLFAIGPGTTNVVYAYAPMRLHGTVRPFATGCEGWGTPGDGGDYRLDVRMAGSYRVALSCVAVTGRLTLQFAVADAALEADVSGDDPHVLGVLTLPEGRHELRVRVTAADPQGEAAFTRLTAFDFELMA